MVVVPSVLDAVTVHAEGALCTRLASVPSDKGRLPTQVRIDGLPLGLRADSLRAAVLEGPHGLLVRDLRPIFDVRLPPEADLPTEQRALEEAQQKLAGLTAELERLQREVQSLQKLKPSFPPRKKDEPTEPRETALTAILSLAGFVDTELAALHSRQLDLERQQREAAEEVRLHHQRLEEASSSVRGQRAQLYRAALLTLSEVGPVEHGARLVLEYAVQGARWVPGYDLRMPRALDGGTLRMRASIIQRTGEDWSNVRLSLSTADLLRRADVPELKSLRIGRRQPPPARSGWREPPPGLDELFTGYDALRRPAPPPPVQRKKEHRASTGEFSMAEASAPAPLLAAPSAAPPPLRISQSMPAVSAAPPAPSKGMPRASGAFPSAPPPPRGGAAPDKKRANLLKSPKLETREEAPQFESDDDEVTLSGFDSEVPLDEESAPPASLQPQGDLLDYGRLELGAASQPGLRGRLQPQSESLSRELFALASVSVQVDVVALVAESQRTAATIRHVSPPAWSVPPRQSTPHFDHRFDVETRVDVPSDGVWHTLSVFSAPVGLTAEYVCVPSLEPRAFRSVKVENHTPHALLAGPVDITLGEEFLMTSPLPTLAPGATQRLGLGVEESLKVSRNTRFEEASGGVFSGATTLTHHVAIELANRTQQPVTVEVLERVPAVPASERDIKVEEGEVKPAWSERELLPGETPVEGERAWRVTLRPGETRALSATWVVRIPSSKMLQGGNRRT